MNHSSNKSNRTRLRRVLGGVAAATAAVLVLAGCQSAGTGSSSDSGLIKPKDDGAKLTLWTRLAADSSLGQLVDAYNKSHKNQIKLTSVPGDSYLQKVGAAAGSKSLPDILASDVVLAASLSSKGIFQDLTKNIDALPFRRSLAPGHLEASTIDRKTYAVPAVVDVSALFYNKVLTQKAGITTPPTTIAEVSADAEKVRALGGSTYGYYIAGNCPGCNMFVGWPSIWASGQEAMNADGSASALDNSATQAWLQSWHDMTANATIPAAAKEENGATWTTAFQNGTIGYQPFGALGYATLKQSDKVQIGVTAIPGVSGGQSTFIGGDVMGIGASSTHTAEAWDFINWALSKTAQVNVVSKNHALVVRSDLADNEYSSTDPNLVTLAKLVADGRSPNSPTFGQVFTDANGPWNKLVRDGVYNSTPAEAIKNDNAAISAALKP